MQPLVRVAVAGALLASSALALPAGPGAAADTVRALTVTPDARSYLVAPTTGLVSHGFIVRLVNAGQQGENTERGVTATSDSVTYSMSSVTNPLGPGQTQTTTFTLNGRGGLFPYWADFWAQIEGYPATRTAFRLSLDTAATAVRPVCTVSRATADAGPRMEVYTADGRLVAVRDIGATGLRMVRNASGAVAGQVGVGAARSEVAK